jgi:CheY-like chemotaxis protein
MIESIAPEAEITKGGASHVLVLEDNPGDVRLITEALTADAAIYKVHVVNTGADALRFLQRKGAYSNAPRPKVILLDLNVPEVDGFEVLHAVKNDEGLKTIPVIVFSSSTEDKDVTRAYDLRANAYVPKPFALQDYFDCLQAIAAFWVHIAQSAVQPPDSAAATAGRR